jgi:hypothetical protein
VDDEGGKTMSILLYFKIFRIILLISMIAFGWLTIQKDFSWVPLTIFIIDAVLLIMTDIRIKEYENNL